MTDRDKEEAYQKLYEKYRVLDGPADKDSVIETKKKKALEDAHRKGNGGPCADSCADDFCELCAEACGEGCCEWICSGH